MLKFGKNVHFNIITNTQKYKQFLRNINVTSYNKEKEESVVEPNVIIEKDQNITLIGLNRPEHRNSIDSATASLLCEALNKFEADETSPVAVLYGIGGSFCAGYDVKELEEQIEKGSLEFLLKRDGAAGPTRRHLRKPVVAGINGFCVGNGLELALMCDLRVMEDTAVMGFFNRYMGVPLSDGGTVRLAASVGYSRALDLITTGRRITAQEALEIGLINRIVTTGTGLGQAVNLACSIEKFPNAALQHDRNTMYANVYDKKEFRIGAQNEVLTISHDVLQEMKEGVIRFEKSKTKGSRTKSWDIKQKFIPDWEKTEIEHEERYAREKKNKNK
ncbi:probable enoyl-CoA hydratase [Teleopsis dalmanni]|uniref:probable enoyl-CoA hydratase n=1 Tax=Teleopsis dalmanni TaxID=139649 RepID=UPI0018CF8B49|nr:probable enoyl-CoA hydratase [Teleopsis dalmanni]